MRVLMGKETVLRRGRGYAPLPIQIGKREAGVGSRVLAVGAHLKNTIAVSMDQHVFLSQHIGDLETAPAFAAFQQTIASFQQIYELQPTAIACDLHPDYRSTQFAHQLAHPLSIPVIPVQHHHAHVLSCMAEHQLEGAVLGIAWDGSGYGLDGTIWGGEFLHVTDTGFQRVAHLCPFPLPGGDTAVKEPRRSAIGLLYELFGDPVFEMASLAPVTAFSAQELKILRTMLSRHLNTPITSSAGRLFDAIAAIVGLQQHTQFEGQAAMALEFAIQGFKTDQAYPFATQSIRPLRSLKTSEVLAPLEPIIIDWAVMVKAILADRCAGLSIGNIAAKFHNTMVEMMVAVAKQIGEEQVVLTGGCFQNKYLTERAIQHLRVEGFRPYWHQKIPTNDGGIALGQIMAARRELSGRTTPCV